MSPNSPAQCLARQLEIDDSDLRRRLMNLYLQLDAYPEVAGVLQQLRGGGMKTAILSNGSPKMLGAAVDNAGIGPSLDAVISVDRIKVYKTAPGHGPRPEPWRSGRPARSR